MERQDSYDRRRASAKETGVRKETVDSERQGERAETERVANKRIEEIDQPPSDRNQSEEKGDNKQQREVTRYERIQAQEEHQTVGKVISI
jgi:hypothetical protein